ncbi:MAG: ISAzo13 family transposase, partial [Methylomicrobium sp.]|nr:ISAzo13 family transposase [Methylomicrobium sp.]
MKSIAELFAKKDPLYKIKQRYDAVSPFLDEKQRRLFVAAEALTYGEGGITKVSQILGVSTSTVSKGIKELQNPETIETERIRRPGGGRKRTVDTDPTLRSDLEKLIDPATRGEPDSPLKWTSKNTRKLAAALNEMGHYTSEQMVCRLLHEMGYSLQANRKTQEGSSHPDRNAQFEHINETVQTFQKEGQPVISVDTKKKELVGNFKNDGQEWQPKNTPESVQVHDFVDKELGKVNPYGIYDMAQNNAWVNVGTDHDTAAFAVESIRGCRSRLWKTELQQLSNETGLAITICHFPPGTSKWNKIEHRLFSHITQNWRGRPLVSHET